MVNPFQRQLTPSECKSAPMASRRSPLEWSSSLLIGGSAHVGSFYTYYLTHPPDDSNWYLSLGSFWTGIKSMKSVKPSSKTVIDILTSILTLSINPSSGLLRDSSVTSLATRTANSGAIEASSIFKFNNLYYLFTSWDNCCQGTSSTYNIRVGRSTSWVPSPTS